MIRAVLWLFLAVLLPFSLCACEVQSPETPMAEWSAVYAPTEIALPDGWYFDFSPDVLYHAVSRTVTAKVHYELPPLEGGFIPFIYGTATLSPDGDVLSIQSENEQEAPSYNKDAAAAQNAYAPIHDGADIWMTKHFSDGTSVSAEAMYTDHEAGLWLIFRGEQGDVLSEVTPTDLFGYDILDDIGAKYGADIFSVLDICKLSDRAGNPLYAILTNHGLAAVKKDGTLAWVSDLRSVTALIPTENSGVLVLTSARGKQSLSLLDCDSGHSAGVIALDEQLQTDGDSMTLFAGDNGALYAGNRRGIWLMSVTEAADGTMTAAGTLLCDLALSEIAVSDIASVAAYDEKTLYFALRDDSSEKTERSCLYRYEYVEPEDVIVKEEIVLARLGTHAFLESVVRDFNRASDTHRIVIRDYTQYADNEARRRAVDTDIASGNIPDLFFLAGDSDIADVYSRAGVFADLKAIIPGYEDLLGCVTAPFEVPLSDGTAAQYLLPMEYSVSTYAAHTEDFGDAVYASVTAEEMLEFYKSIPADTAVMYNSYDLQKYLLQANLDGYYDTLTGSCTLDSGALAALMEESQPVYDSAEYLGEDFSTVVDFYDDFRAGSIRLLEVSVRGLTGWVRLHRALGEFTPIGYPNCEDRHYARISVSSYLAVSSQSEHTAQIAQFFSLWFARSREQMYDQVLFTPDDINASLAMYADQTFIENGESTGFVNDVHADSYTGDKYKLTRADADALCAFLDAVDARVNTDAPAAKIFWEEFYNRGSRSWDEVMDAAQSRMAIYLSEQQ